MLVTSTSNGYNIRNLSSSLKYTYASLKWWYKTPAKEDLMSIISIKSYQSLTLSIISSILHILIIA